MGAHSDYRIYEAPNAEAAKKLAAEIMASARHEMGHDSYAGHIGIAAGIRLIDGAPMAQKAADEKLFGKPALNGRDWVEGLCEKWGPAILIRIQNTGSRKARWMLGAMCAS